MEKNTNQNDNNTRFCAPRDIKSDLTTLSTPDAATLFSLPALTAVITNLKTILNLHNSFAFLTQGATLHINCYGRDLYSVVLSKLKQAALHLSSPGLRVCAPTHYKPVLGHFSYKLREVS